MVKRYVALAFAGLLMVQMIQAGKYGRRFSFTSPAEVGHVPADLERAESTRARDHAKMVRSLLEQGPRLKAKYALSENPSAEGLVSRLTEFTHTDAVKALLNARFDLVDETIGSWKHDFSECLAGFGAEIKSFNDHMLMFQFSDMPRYNILMSVSAYDTKDGDRKGFNCNFWCTPDCEFSPYEFPLHLVSRVLCAAEINGLGLSNVRAARHWLFDFSEDPLAALNDRDVFVVAENIGVAKGIDAKIADDLRKMYANYTQEALTALAEDVTDESLMANLVRAIKYSGIWNIKPSTRDPVFTLNLGGSPYAIFSQVERPSTGKPAFWFHDYEGTRPDGLVAGGGKEEIRRDADDGLSALVKWLHVESVVSEEGGSGAGASDE